jgi:hypothetical protein
MPITLPPPAPEPITNNNQRGKATTNKKKKGERKEAKVKKKMKEKLTTPHPKTLLPPLASATKLTAYAITSWSRTGHRHQSGLRDRA